MMGIVRNLSPMSLYPGFKGRVAPLVWERLGDPVRYVEPFAGSGAVFFARPGHRNGAGEVLNDASGLLVNALRGLRESPESIARLLDHPGTSLDLHAAWVRCHEKAPVLAQSLAEDPDYVDVGVAALFLYGITWAVHPRAFTDQDRGAGPGRVKARSDGAAARWRLDSASVSGWLREVQSRLTRCAILCGDWRAALTPAVLQSNQTDTVGIFLDPPYGLDRMESLYHADSMTIAGDVLQWCKDHGQSDRLRVCLAGYTGEHDELEDLGWSVHAWSSSAGGESRSKERLWFSPHCNDAAAPQLDFGAAS